MSDASSNPVAQGLAKRIEQQTQPNGASCTQTCIAMALGVPVAELGVPLDNGLDFDDFGVYLAERGVWLRRCIIVDGRGERFQQGCVYIVGVRSLNLIGGDHAVILDARGEATNTNPRSGWKFYDPNVGRDGLKVYTWVDDTGQVVDFCELRDRSRWGVVCVGNKPAPAVETKAAP